MRKALAASAIVVFMTFVILYSAPILADVDTVVCAGRYGAFVSTTDTQPAGLSCTPAADVARYVLAAFLASGAVTLAGIVLSTRHKAGHASLG